MLPTPSTSHVAFERIYEPAEDSYLLLDTLSAQNEKAFLSERFNYNTGTMGQHSPAPVVFEIGTGSGVVIAFLHAFAEVIFGRADIITSGVDVNSYACKATEETVKVAEKDQTTQTESHGFYLGNTLADLTSCLKSGAVDILVFNPPYVPTPELPALPTISEKLEQPSYEDDSHLLSLSYAGGADGMETTNRLFDDIPRVLSKDRGCAYILLCAQNNPTEVKERIRNWGTEWMAETVGSSGKKAGWEKLQIIRIWRVEKIANSNLRASA
ncbi:putative methyltransferase [Bisporella sp. PMI_857]|jgi:release factor glutamine methyltransferase|nr:putative methyltransferase [Bisporella sp. PMI_857]